MNIRNFFSFAVLVAAPLAGQLAAPNSAGVAIAHVHLNVGDLEAEQQFWTKVGGVPVTNEKVNLIQFPGIYVMLRKQDSTGPILGSVVNHFGFHVKNLEEWLPKWKAAGLNIEHSRVNPKAVFLTAADDSRVRVEMIEDTTIATSMAMHHIHIHLTDPLAGQAWYVKNFGAVAGNRNNNPTATVPGAELTFTKEEKAQAPTKGRTLDHIGFEVKNIDEFVKKLQASGIQTEAGVRKSQNAPLRLAYITDPWGTYIELTEGLAPARAASASR